MPSTLQTNTCPASSKVGKVQKGQHQENSQKSVNIEAVLCKVTYRMSNSVGVSIGDPGHLPLTGAHVRGRDINTRS